MARSRRKLRRRLALEFVLIAGAIHLILIVVTIGVREAQLRQQFDADLLRRAERIAGAAAQDVAPHAAVPTAVREEVLSAGMTPMFAQARNLEGEIVSRTGNLDGSVLPLPFDASGAASRQQVFYSTIDGATVGRPGEPFRLITFYDDGPPPYYLQAAVSAQPVSEVVASLRQLLFLLALPGAMLGTGIAAWLISGHVVRRIDDVSRAAQRVSPSQMHPRLDLPAAGDEIGGMVVEMNSMLSRLENAFRAQERFIVDVTHELKTPVSVMLAEAQVLKNSRAAGIERYREFVISVEEEMRRLGSLLESFLTLARSGHGQRYVSETLVDLTDVVLEAMKQADAAARDRQISLKFTLPEEEGMEAALAVRGDPELLTTLIANLIRSAAEETSQGDAVEVGIEPADSEVRVTISHRIAHDGDVSLRARSRALAFDVAKGIAELHGGEVSTTRNADISEASLRLPTVAAA
jgi:signal transduction histidine kinase